MHLLKYVMDWLRPLVHAALDEMKGFTFWISVQVRYTHPAKELPEMRPKSLHTAKRRLMKHELEKLQAMVESMVLRNDHFLRQSSGLVLVDVLSFRYKGCEFLPLVGREFKQVHTLLAKKNAIVNVKIIDNRCFGYGIASALVKPVDPVDRAVNYSHQFQKHNLDKINYSGRDRRHPRNRG